MEHRSISIADQIFEQLEREILSGTYTRGDVLSELGLSKQLGVSRTPVREAIRRLEQEELLEESGRGMLVIGISREDMLDMYEIRMQLEGRAARRAAENITEEELQTMREILDLQRFYCEKGGESNSEQIKDLDSRFHELFYRSCRSKPYYNTLLALHKRMMKFRKASVSQNSRAMQSLEEHEAICSALEARDPDAAEAATLTHVRNAGENMKKMEI